MSEQQHRSAITGEYVSQSQAAANPDTTVSEKSPKQTPGVGRVVHYVSYGTPKGEFTSQCRAATITEVEPVNNPNQRVGLAVLNPTGLFFHQLSDGGCAYSTKHEGGTWHWPERV
jgi:hypothetical protein